MSKFFTKVISVSFIGSTVMLMLFLSFSTSAESSNRIYWADAQTSMIQRANLDGTNLEDVVITGPFPLGLDIDVAGGKIYWTEVGPNKIRRANFDGTGIEDLVGSVGSRTIALDVAGGKMYWIDAFVFSKIQRANLDGTDVEDLYTVGSDRAGIALDVAGGKMYWTDRQVFKGIQRANLNGTDVETIVSGLTDPRQITLDIAGGKMYWADAQAGKIQRANLNGSGVEDLVTGLVNPHGIALDVEAGIVFWTDFGSDKVQRANLDGTGVEDLVTGLGNPVEIVLELAEIEIITVDVDIKPGDGDLNCINPNSNGNTPVAILYNSIDVNDIVVSTIEIDSDADPNTIGVIPVKTSFKDINSDLADDLIIHFNTSELDEEGLLEDGIELFITGELTDGTGVVGSDFINIAGGPNCSD